MDNTIHSESTTSHRKAERASARAAAGGQRSGAIVSTSSPTQVSDEEEDPEGGERNPGEHLDARPRTDGIKMRPRRMWGRPDLNRPPNIDLGMSTRDNDPHDIAPDVRGNKPDDAEP